METTQVLPKVVPCFSGKDGVTQTSNDEVPDSKGEGMDGEDDVTSIPTGIATLISNTIVSGTFRFIRLHVYNMATFQHAQLLGHRLQNLPLVELFGVFSVNRKTKCYHKVTVSAKCLHVNRALVSWDLGSQLHILTKFTPLGQGPLRLFPSVVNTVKTAR